MLFINFGARLKVCASKPARTQSRNALGAIRQTDMTLRLINPKYYLTKLTDIGRFIVKPIGQPTDNKTTIDKVTDLLVILVITLTFSLLAFYLNVYYIKPVPTTKLFDWQQKLGPVYFFLFSVFLIPLVEESSFRLPLKFSSLFLSISFALFSYKFISNVFFDSPMYILNSYPISRISFAIIVAFLFYLFISKEKISSRTELFWSRHFRLIFYTFSIYFSFMHINNYVPSSYNILLIPIITLPQLILGLTAGYMRINYGFIYAFGLHALYNSSPYWLPF